MGQVRRASTTSTSTSSSRHALLLPRSRGTADDCYILSGSSRRLRPTSTAALLLRYSTAKRFRLSDGTYARCTNESWSCQQGGGGAPARSFVRAFGGQSVVPWELALFLVEEMKGEGVEPGDVVYTAALAECRWAGQAQHVDYLLQQMEAKGMTIVPAAVAAATTAAKTADKALATVEAMWATADHEPSPTTCRAALDACVAGGQWERALSLVRDSAGAMDSDDGGDGGDGVAGGSGVDYGMSFSRRVEVLALAGRWIDAFLLVQQEGAE
eukprot:jgi/Undpi1/1671/HiC_scaffold_11.g05061.m1